jgi:hypothetical protein
MLEGKAHACVLLTRAPFSAIRKGFQRSHLEAVEQLGQFSVGKTAFIVSVFGQWQQFMATTLRRAEHFLEHCNELQSDLGWFLMDRK